LKHAGRQPTRVARRGESHATAPVAAAPVSPDDVPGAWDVAMCNALIERLAALRLDMLAREAALQPTIEAIDPAHRASARNLAHYLSLRSVDLRALQDGLARLGLSSLGRSESNVMASVNKVLGILHRLAGRPWTPLSADEPAGIYGSRQLLERHTAALFGPPPPARAVRIMVTLPTEAAFDYGLAKKLMPAGMDIARINCAHDGPEAWQSMAALVRRAARAAGRPVRILMDLAGPKLRTTGLPPGPAVLKLRPRRDEFGRVVAPARLGLRPDAASPAVADADAQVSVDAGWLARLREGDTVRLDDARGARRKLSVVRCDPGGVLLECEQTTYLVPDIELRHRAAGNGDARTALHDLPRQPAALLLKRGDRLRLARDAAPAQAARRTASGRAPVIGCTLPEVFTQVRKGERVGFDDGRIGGVVVAAGKDAIDVEITDVRQGGDKLLDDKGINLPDSELELAAPTGQDLADLAVAARCADLVGLSFVQTADDVARLRSAMADLGVEHLGMLLKVETRRGFENLPELLLAAMCSPASGVMIARGDLAVECGYERLAEVQEEILWACEAAHMPVVWATQVLESLAKTGRPSRAEITDAAMGVRAECVMLNKGPYIVDAMRTLDDILTRMQAHQSKKRPLLRALRAWSWPDGAGAPGAKRARKTAR
jgi:pyruvate kinase